jgi:hypothetical protein
VLDPSLVDFDLDEFRRLVQPTARPTAATAATALAAPRRRSPVP